MRRAEDRGGIVQKRLFLALHPGLVGHVGRDVVNLPVVSDAKVIGQDLTVDEDEPVLPEMAVVGAIVDVLDQIVVVIGPLRQKIRERCGVFDLLKIIAAVCPTGRARTVDDKASAACSAAGEDPAPAL